MNVILFDDPSLRLNLLPFTFTRPTSKIRIGILTIDEKWAIRLQTPVSFLTEPYLQKKYPLHASTDNLLINGAVCPDDQLIDAVRRLEPGHQLVLGTVILAARQRDAVAPAAPAKQLQYTKPVTFIDRPWKIFEKNAGQIKADFKLITAGRQSAGIEDKHTIVYGGENVFVEEGVDIKASIINAETGPVYLGKNSVIQEGAMIRGSFALCEGSHVSMGAKIRGDSTIGPFSKVGGEIGNSVIFGYSNKAHDGYLGNSVLGEWCNLGADTNTSNMKNNYDKVKLWSHVEETFINTDQQFCGLMMGDHSKCGINTMFNTGTVVDVSANVFGDGFPRNYIPSFSWGGPAGFDVYRLDKALETASRAMERRNRLLTEIDKEILTHIFHLRIHTQQIEKI